MREAGETPLPAPVMLEGGQNIELPSREKGRSIPCRVFKPEKGQAKGVFYVVPPTSPTTPAPTNVPASTFTAAAGSSKPTTPKTPTSPSSPTPAISS